MFDVFDDEKDQTDVWSAELEKMSRNERMATEDLCKFIRKNRELIHVDLSYAGLSEVQLWYFGRVMRRAKSVRSLHLTGNRKIDKESITPRLTKYLHARAHCSPESDLYANLIDFSKLPSTLKMRSIMLEEQKQTGVERKLGKEAQRMLAEARKIKHIHYHKKVESKHEDSLDPQEKTLIFSRKLGHKIDIPGSGQWKMVTGETKRDNECWVCDRQVYTLIFWNELIGAAEMSNFSMEDKNYIIDYIKKFENLNAGKQSNFPTQDEPNHLKHPQIYGQFTNWQPKPMYEIKEFCDKLNVNKPNIFKDC